MKCLDPGSSVSSSQMGGSRKGGRQGPDNAMYTGVRSGVEMLGSRVVALGIALRRVGMRPLLGYIPAGQPNAQFLGQSFA